METKLNHCFEELSLDESLKTNAGTDFVCGTMLTYLKVLELAEQMLKNRPIPVPVDEPKPILGLVLLR